MSSARKYRGRNRGNGRSSFQKRPLFFRPRLEILEDRCVPSTVNTWVAPGPDGFWNVDSNWSLSHVPNSTEIATFGPISKAVCFIDAPAAGTNTSSGINITADYPNIIVDS